MRKEECEIERRRETIYCRRDMQVNLTKRDTEGYVLSEKPRFDHEIIESIPVSIHIWTKILDQIVTGAESGPAIEIKTQKKVEIVPRDV